MKDKRPNKKSIVRNVLAKRKGKRFIMVFSDVEDSEAAFEEIKQIAYKAGKNAEAEAKAAGITRIYLRDNSEIVRITSTGEEQLIKPVLDHSSYFVKYEPNTVLNTVGDV